MAMFISDSFWLLFQLQFQLQVFTFVPILIVQENVYNSLQQRQAYSSRDKTWKISSLTKKGADFHEIVLALVWWLYNFGCSKKSMKNKLVNPSWDKRTQSVNVWS